MQLIRLIHFVYISLCFACISNAQSLTSEETTVKSFEILQEKFIAITKDFPQELYDFQPHPDARSYIKEIWHVSSGFGVLSARIKGERPSKELIYIPQNIKYDKEEIEKHLIRNSNECIAALKAKFDPRSISTLAHLSEHYGKIMILYRINNLIPPNSKD